MKETIEILCFIIGMIIFAIIFFNITKKDIQGCYGCHEASNNNFDILKFFKENNHKIYDKKNKGII